MAARSSSMRIIPIEKATESTRAGFDSIVFDLSALPFEQNIRQTRDGVQALKAINPAILVEGEIGDIGTGPEGQTPSPSFGTRDRSGAFPGAPESPSASSDDG